MSIGDRIKTAITAKSRALQASGGVPYSLSDLARAVCVSPQTVQQWTSGSTTPRRYRIEAIASALNSDAVWLETGVWSDSWSQLPPQMSAESNALDYTRVYRTGHAVRVPYYPDVPAAAGHGCVPLDEANVTVLDIARSLLDTAGVPSASAALLQADGDSMRGVIEHGDLMVIDTSARELREGRVFVVSLGGELLVKRVQRIPRGIKLVSENPIYDPITVMDDDQDTDVYLVGRVAFSWRMTRFM